ncbi:MAG: hypothetical protein J0H06_02410 [Actinobacteria bacterium]|nr:hypothetical protein [Actinomycetota bacterium]
MRNFDQRAVLLGLGVIAGAALIVGIMLKSDPSDDNGTATTTSREASSGAAADTADRSTAPEGAAAPEAASAPAPKVPTIVIRDGEPVGGVADLTYDQGERVRFRVTSDIAEEIHLHGYDISKDIDAGGSVTFDFPADLEGVFEVELEERATPIAELAVNP